MYLTIAPCTWAPQRQTLVQQPTHAPRASTSVVTTDLPGLSEFLSRVQIDIQANAASPLTLPELEQQPTLLSIAQVVQAIDLAGALTQREPAFAEAHATAVGSLVQLLEQRQGYGELWLPRHAITVLRALDAIVSSAEPNHRSGPSSSTQAQLRLLSTMQLAPSQTDSQALLPPRLECLLLPCVPYCTGRDLATLQTHLQRLGLTATPAVRDAQGTRISELLAAAVAAEVAAGEAAEEAMEEAAGAPDCQHNPTSNRAASPTGLEANSGLGRQSTCQSTLVHQDTQPGVEQHYNNNNSSSSNIYLRDVLTMLASFSAAGGAPMSLDHTALRDSLPQLLCQAHGKAVADLLREIAVLKIPVSRVQQVALGRAINRHVQEMGAASMSKVVSALSSCRGIAAAVDMNALCAHLMTQLPFFTPRALALTLVNIASLGAPPRSLDLQAYTALISTRAHRMRPAEICNVLKVLGALRVPPTSLDADTIGAALTPHLHVLPPRQLVPALTFFAALGELPPTVDPARLGARVGAALPQLRVPGLVVLCWMVLRLHGTPQGVDPRALCAALAPALPRMGATEVATVAEALAVLATLGNMPDHAHDCGVLTALAAAAGRVFPSAATPGEVVRTLRALRTLRIAGKVRVAAVATAVSRAARAAGSAWELSRLLAMAARVHGVAARLDGGAVGGALHTHAASADGHALARLLWVLTKMEQSPRGVDLAACLRHTLPLAPSLAPRDASLALWSIARLLQRGDIDVAAAWPCVQSLCLAVNRRASVLNGDDLSMILHAASMLPDVPVELDMAALGSATAAALPTLRLRQLSQALATLAALPEPPSLDLQACEDAMAVRLAALHVPGAHTVACDELHRGISSAQHVCRCGLGNGSVQDACEEAPAAAVVECLAAFAAHRHQLHACTLARALPVILQALPDNPLLAAHTLTALAKLRVALPLPITQALWDVMLAQLHRLPAGHTDWPNAAGALRTALWALCVMYASDAPSLVALMPRAQRAAAMLHEHPPVTSVSAKQLLLSRSVFLSLCGGETCNSGDLQSETNEENAEASVSSTQGGRAQGPARGPTRPRLRCDSPAELLSEDLLRSCTMVWEAGARTPVPSTVQRQLAATASMLPSLIAVSQGQQFLEGGLLRGNLGCRLASNGQPVVLCPTKPGRFVGGLRKLDGPMALRCALLRWEGVVPVIVPQREWESLADEQQRGEYLDKLVQEAVASFD